MSAHYSGPSGSFEVRAGAPLTLVANGQSAALQPLGGDLFATHASRFSPSALKFERKGPAITGASWGPSSYLRGGAVGVLPPSDPELAKLAGRYVNDSPWVGMATLVERGGQLWIGTETPMTRISDNLWRIGEESWSPERGVLRELHRRAAADLHLLGREVPPPRYLGVGGERR